MRSFICHVLMLPLAVVSMLFVIFILLPLCASGWIDSLDRCSFAEDYE